MELLQQPGPLVHQLAPRLTQLGQTSSRLVVRAPRAPFRVSFDCVESFTGGALVLRGEDGVVGLELLHEKLKAVLGIKRTSRFVPL